MDELTLKDQTQEKEKRPLDKFGYFFLAMLVGANAYAIHEYGPGRLNKITKIAGIIHELL